MKNLTTIFCLIVFILSFTKLFAQSDVYVKGYYRKSGTYIQPHYKTAPNNSMFDNYSTKGNFNPYTGKQGWIDPYSKVSSTYSNAIPHNYRTNYDNLFAYLNKKDQFNYFKIVNAFSYQYKLFFTGVFKLNNNDTKEANQIFDTLRKYNGADQFITTESDYWFNITSKYLDADEELEQLYASSSQYDKDGNYENLKYQLNNVKNPLNFYNKFLLKFNTDWRRHKYLDAKNSFDSLIVYSSNNERKDSLISGYNDVILNLNNLQNTLDTHLNNTYYYSIDSLISNLRYFVINKNNPTAALERAKFKFLKKGYTTEDTEFYRSLADTSNDHSGFSKYDYLTIHRQFYREIGDTAVVILLRFFDKSSYIFYKNELSEFSNYQNSDNSLVFNFQDPNGKEKGLEYLINDPLIAGLTEEQLDEKTDKNKQKMYRIYLYCMIDPSGRLINLSSIFK